jgi:Arc/MetJ family transcription regulator
MRSHVRHSVRMSRRTNLLLPEELVAEVDRIAGPRGRSRYVSDAVQAQLRRDRLREVVEQTAGSLAPEDYPQWSTPERVVAWVRARRAEVSGPGVTDP